MAEPLTPAEEAKFRTSVRAIDDDDVAMRLLATLDALRASLDPERPEAAAAWAAALFSVLGWRARYNPSHAEQWTVGAGPTGRGNFATYDPLPDGILSGDADNPAWAQLAAALLADDPEPGA